MSAREGRWGLAEYAPDALCPKCWGEEISTVYKPNAHCVHYPDRCVVADKVREPDCCSSAKSEHIHRQCRRCRYWWAQDVVEQGAS